MDRRARAAGRLLAVAVAIAASLPSGAEANQGYWTGCGYSCRAGTEWEWGRYRSCHHNYVSKYCLSCPAGQSNNKKGGECKNCAPGQYAGNEGSKSCQTCDVGQYAGNGGSISCQTCVVGQYASSATASSCQNCEPGRYQDEDPNTHNKCKVCGTGQYASSATASSCQNCEPGRYQDEDPNTHNKCKVCGTGQYAGGTKSKSCETCVDGKYAAVTESKQCSTCDPGQSSPSSTEPCADCSPGNYQQDAPSTSYGCDDCPTGFSQPLTKQTSCAACMTGRFANEKGTPTCTTWETCSKGMGRHNGSTSKDAWCDYCPDGWFQPDDNAVIECKKWTSSQPCPPGVTWGGGSGVSDQSCGGKPPPPHPPAPTTTPSPYSPSHSGQGGSGSEASGSASQANTGRGTGTTTDGQGDQGSGITIVVIIVLLTLIVAATMLAWWWKVHRKLNGDDSILGLVTISDQSLEPPHFELLNDSPESRDEQKQHKLAQSRQATRATKSREKKHSKAYRAKARPGFLTAWYIDAEEIAMPAQQPNEAEIIARMVDDKRNSKSVVLGRIATEHITPEELMTFELKIRALQKWSYPATRKAAKFHPHIAKIDGLFRRNNTSEHGKRTHGADVHTYIVMDHYGHDGSVADEIVRAAAASGGEAKLSSPSSTLPSYDGFQAVQWAWQIAAALHYLHGKKTCHGDIRASNIMLTRQKQDTKLVGFVPDKEKCLCVKAFCASFRAACVAHASAPSRPMLCRRRTKRR